MHYIGTTKNVLFCISDVWELHSLYTVTYYRTGALLGAYLLLSAYLLHFSIQ